MSLGIQQRIMPVRMATAQSLNLSSILVVHMMNQVVMPLLSIQSIGHVLQDTSVLWTYFYRYSNILCDYIFVFASRIAVLMDC